MNQAVQSELGLFVPAIASAWLGLWAGTALRWVPGRGTSWEHSYFEAQVKETPNLFHSGRSPHFELLLNKCGLDSVMSKTGWKPSGRVLPEDAAAAWDKESFTVCKFSLLAPWGGSPQTHGVRH